MKNPFQTEYGETVDADSRIASVKEFTAEECRAALKLTDLQKTVRKAIERRAECLRLDKRWSA